MENAIKLETIPELAPWRWYTETFQQWATAFLLLVEIYSYPMRREADRIWDIIDYVFEPDRSLSRAQKGRVILSEFRDKTAIYRDIRKLRAPVSMTKRIQKPPRRVGDSFDPNAPMNSSKNQAETPDTLSNSSPGHMVDSPSPHLSADSVTASWSFDTPATLLFHKGYSKNEVHQIPGFQPRQQADPGNIPNYQGVVSSPSDAGTNDSWPPFISNQQQSWNLMIPAESNFQVSSSQGQAMPTIPGVAGICLAVPDMPLSAPFRAQVSAGNSNFENGGDPMALDIDWVTALHIYLWCTRG
jgi:hypothetical protein